MIYLVALIFSPLALLLAGKPFQAIFNFLFWILGFVTYGAMWLVALAHAILSIHSARADKRNRQLIAAIKEGRGL